MIMAQALLLKRPLKIDESTLLSPKGTAPETTATAAGDRLADWGRSAS